MTRTHILASLALAFAALSHAPLAHARDDRRPVARRLTLAYYGDLLTHPGVSLGGEHELVGWGGHSFFGGLQLAAYHHAGFHTALLTTAEFGYRYTFGSGFYGDLRVSAGYAHTWLAGSTWTPDGNGGFASVAGASRGAFAPGGALTMGWDFSRRAKAPLSVFARISCWEQLPVNDVAALHIAGQLGVAIHFDR
ncbi:MAG: hypothetical protein U0326_33915 [Polyangiales bacterium]